MNGMTTMSFATARVRGLRNRTQADVATRMNNPNPNNPRYIDNPVPTAPGVPAANSYEGQTGTAEIDEHGTSAVGHAEYRRQCFVHFRIIRIIGAKVERVRFFKQHQVLDAHRRLACVVHTRRQFRARIIDVRARHAGR